MRHRVVLFVDYQNAYKDARALFRGRGRHPQAGQFDPLRLGELIARRSPWASRELAQVRVYRGRPDRTKDLRAHSANVRQSAVQETSGRGKVTVITRPLGACAELTPKRTKGTLCMEVSGVRPESGDA